MQLATFQNKMIPLLEQHMRHYLAQFTENKTLQAATVSYTHLTLPTTPYV